MCETTGDNVRVFRVGSGKLTQCIQCQTLGFQIGTAYFAVSPLEMPRLLEWFQEVRETKAIHLGGQQTLFLQMKSSRIMLALSAHEVDYLWEMFQQGWEWSQGAPIPAPEWTLASEAVH